MILSILTRKKQIDRSSSQSQENEKNSKLTNGDLDSQIDKSSSQIPTDQSLQFPIQLKVMSQEETKKYHRKKLYELSLKSIGEIPQLDEPNDEQKEWVIRKMKSPSWAWRSFT